MAYIDEVKKKSIEVGYMEYNKKIGKVYCAFYKSNYFVIYDILPFIEETKKGLRLPTKLLDGLNGMDMRNHLQKDRFGYNLIQVISCENEKAFTETIVSLKKIKKGTKLEISSDKLKEFKASIVADAI